MELSEQSLKKMIKQKGLSTSVSALKRKMNSFMDVMSSLSFDKELEGYEVGKDDYRDFISLFCVSISSNKAVYHLIDDIYKMNSSEFYIRARSSKWYSFGIFQRYSLLHEEYSKKMLGILLYVMDMSEEEKNTSELLMKVNFMLKMGWADIHNFVRSRNPISLEDYKDSNYDKMTKLDNVEDVCGTLSIVLVCAMCQIGKTFDTSGLGYLFYRASAKKTLVNLSGDSMSSTLKQEVIKHKDEVKAVKRRILAEVGNINDFHKVYTDRDIEIHSYIGSQLTYSGLSYVALTDNKITEDDINLTIMSFMSFCTEYLHTPVEDIDTDLLATYTILMLHSLLLQKAYKTVKNHYFENNKETVFLEMDALKKEIVTLNSQLQKEKNLSLSLQTKLSSKQETITPTIDKEIDSLKTIIKSQDADIVTLSNKIKKLEADLDKERENSIELHALREFVFELGMDGELSHDTIPDYTCLKDIRGIVIGGHERWRTKMKEHLPKFSFINPNIATFDLSLLDGCKVLFVFNTYINHPMYYRAVNHARINNMKIVYINSVNEDKVLKTIYDSIL
jgi:hypothetical protein